MPEAIDTSTARPEASETFIAELYREYLKIDEACAREEAGCQNSLAGKAAELGMRVATQRADTLDDLLVKAALLRDELAVDVGEDAFHRISFVAANSLMADLHRFKAAPECFGLEPASPAGQDDEDPILPLYREWWDGMTEWYRIIRAPDHDEETPEEKEAYRRWDEACSAIRNMTPTSMAGIAALAHVFWEFSGCSAKSIGAELYEAECNNPERKPIALIWRAASGKDGWPPHPADELGVRA